MSVIDEKLKDFEIKIDGKLLKPKENCKAMFASSAKHNKKVLKDEPQKKLLNLLRAVEGVVPNPLGNQDVCITTSNVPERVNKSPTQGAEQVMTALGNDTSGVSFSVFKYCQC